MAPPGTDHASHHSLLEREHNVRVFFPTFTLFLDRVSVSSPLTVYVHVHAHVHLHVHVHMFVYSCVRVL